jgi:hypothetical protein
VDLAGAAAAGGNPAGDLPEADRLALARPVADAPFCGGVAKVVVVLATPVIRAPDDGELVGGQVGGGSLAPGEQVEPAPVMSANRAGDQPESDGRRRDDLRTTRQPHPWLARTPAGYVYQGPIRAGHP